MARAIVGVLFSLRIEREGREPGTLSWRDRSWTEKIRYSIAMVLIYGGLRSILTLRQTSFDWRDAWACRNGRSGLTGVEALSFEELVTRVEALGHDWQAWRESPERHELYRRAEMGDPLSRREMREQHKDPVLHKRFAAAAMGPDYREP
jgi:hypothetical protein